MCLIIQEGYNSNYSAPSIGYRETAQSSLKYWQTFNLLNVWRKFCSMEPKNDVMQERNIQLFAADREEEEKMNGCAVSRKTIFKEMNRSGKKDFF